MHLLKLLIYSLLLVMALLLAMPAIAQEEDPGPAHFVWLGAGVDGFSVADKPTGFFGYGFRIADGSFLVSNIVMTDSYSTLSEAFIKRITRQGPVTLLALGELGIETGSGPGIESAMPVSPTATLSLGTGLGIEISLGFISPKLKDVGALGLVKILKDRTSEVSNAIRPRYAGGIVYKFGK